MEDLIHISVPLNLKKATMNLDRTYIIPEGADLELRISRTGSTISIHHNGGTKCFDIAGATSLKTALMAVLSGAFDYAITETELRLRAEREARAAGAAQSSPPPLPPPALENL